MPKRWDETLHICSVVFGSISTSWKCRCLQWLNRLRYTIYNAYYAPIQAHTQQTRTFNFIIVPTYFVFQFLCLDFGSYTNKYSSRKSSLHHNPCVCRINKIICQDCDYNCTVIYIFPIYSNRIKCVYLNPDRVQRLFASFIFNLIPFLLLCS